VRGGFLAEAQGQGGITPKNGRGGGVGAGGKGGGARWKGAEDAGGGGDGRIIGAGGGEKGGGLTIIWEKGKDPRENRGMGIARGEEGRTARLGGLSSGRKSSLKVGRPNEP